jgi:hypothetical protein
VGNKMTEEGTIGQLVVSGQHFLELLSSAVSANLIAAGERMPAVVAGFVSSAAIFAQFRSSSSSFTALGSGRLCKVKQNRFLKNII